MPPMKISNDFFTRGRRCSYSRVGTPSTGSVVVSVSRGGASPQVGGFPCGGGTGSEGQWRGPETEEKREIFKMVTC